MGVRSFILGDYRSLCKKTLFSEHKKPDFLNQSGVKKGYYFQNKGRSLFLKQGALALLSKQRAIALFSKSRAIAFLYEEINQIAKLQKCGFSDV